MRRRASSRAESRTWRKRLTSTSTASSDWCNRAAGGTDTASAHNETKVVHVIEDNDANLRLVQMVLQFQGYQVLAARTAEDGLALAAEQQPAVILMDIQLPGMDGAD